METVQSFDWNDFKLINVGWTEDETITRAMFVPGEHLENEAKLFRDPKCRFFGQRLLGQ